MNKKRVILSMSLMAFLAITQATFAMAPRPTPVKINKNRKIEINLDGILGRTNLTQLIRAGQEKDVISISFKNNNLTGINPQLKSFIQKFPNLEAVYMGGQKLSWLEDDLFDKTQSLKTVGLSYNLFIDIPQAVQKKSKSLQKIYLGGNPIAYDTYMKWTPQLKNVVDIAQPAQTQGKRHLSVLSGISATGFKSLENLLVDVQKDFSKRGIQIKSTDPNHWHMTLATYFIYPKSGLTAAQETALKTTIDKAMNDATTQAIQGILAQKRPNNINLSYSDSVQILNKFIVALFQDTQDARLLIKKVQSNFLENISQLIKNGDIVQIYNPYPDFKAHVSIGVDANNNPLPNQGATIKTQPISQVAVRDFVISKPTNLVLSHWRN